jgi:hypothetical protein
VTITYESLTDLVNDLSSDAATAEAILMQAAYKINGYGYDMTVISGSEESRSGSYTEAEAGWLLNVAVQIYVEYYKTAGASSESYSLGGINSSQSTSQGSGRGTSDALAKKAANQLNGRSFVRA